MKVFTYIIVGILTVSLSGCVTVEKVVRDRVDREMPGNRGYIQGAAPGGSGEISSEKREYIDVKLELPTFKEFREKLPRAKQKQRTVDRKDAGNEGYLDKEKGFEEELPPARKEEPMPVQETVESSVYEDIEEGYAEDEDYMSESPAAVTTYKVKPGDSLSKISKEVYGKASKWTVIYEANADKIKDPNSIREGIVLTIPALEEVESEYAK